MRKKAIVFIVMLTLLLPSTLLASGGYLSTSLGLSFPERAFILSDGTSRETDPKDALSGGGKFMISGGYEFSPWFALGLGTGLDYSQTSIDGNIGVFTVPLMLEMIISPNFGVISIPIKIAAGGHVQFSDNKYIFGPSANTSVGIQVNATENFSVSYSAGADLHVQFAKDFSRTLFAINLIPLTLSMRVGF